MKRLLLTFVLWVCVVNAFAILASNRLNLNPDTAYGWQDPSDYHQDKNWNMPAVHARWDSIWYLDIAKNGYSYSGDLGNTNTVFFPLYPIAIRIVALLTFGHFPLAGWLVSITFLFFALVYFRRLLIEFHPDIDPFVPITLLLVFPTAFFLSAVYTESMFLFLSIASFYSAFRKNFLLAGIFGLVASLTRITGLFLFLPLAWEFWLHSRTQKRPLTEALPLLFIPAGVFSFFLYHYLVFGDFFLWLKVEREWGRGFTLTKEHFLLDNASEIVNFSLDISFVMLGLAAAFFVFKKLRTSYGIYMLTTVLIAVGSGTLMSINRYVLCLFPMYILLGKTSPVVRQAVTYVSILFFALYTILFAGNYWAG